MPYDPQRHHRRSIRLQGYDYAQAGAYFITICTYQREMLFGQVVEGEVRLTPPGEMVWETWHDLVNHIGGVHLDEFVVMPNHVHGIVMIMDVGSDVGAGSEPAPTDTGLKRHGLPEIVRQLKTFSARRINAWRGTPGTLVWQRNYYEHIVRHADDLNRIRVYIRSNPANWTADRENPARLETRP